MKKFNIESVVELDNFIKTIRENSIFSTKEIKLFLIRNGKWPACYNVFYSLDNKNKGLFDKIPIMQAIYKTMENQKISNLYVINEL